MDSNEKTRILRIVELLAPLDWIGFNSPEDTFFKNQTHPYQYGVIEMLCDTGSMVKLFSGVSHCEETKLFNAIVHIIYGPNQSVICLRFGYVNKALRCLEAIFSDNTTPYESARRTSNMTDHDCDDLSFLKGSKVKKITDIGERITCVLKFREQDARDLLIENYDDFSICGVTCTYRIGCTYNVLMHVSDMSKLISQWMKK
jgi:hypothetical protein